MFYNLINDHLQFQWLASVLAGHLLKKLAKRVVLWRHCREGVSTEQAARFRN